MDDMKRWKTKIRIGLIISNLMIVSVLCGQEKTINYQSTSAPITNPERGWYDQFSSHSGGSSLGTVYKSLKASELRSNREDDGITLILRLFYLHEFLEQTSVSEAYLEKMQADFDSVRSAGIKCIVRFAYSASQSAAVWDATPDKVFSHITSLRDVLSNNSDVIAAVQAGFIGAWGEWYYSKNFAGNGYVPDATDQQNRITLFESLLNILPENIVVEGRTPAIMKNVAKTVDPIGAEEAYDGSFKSRIGHHNDCFVASSTDYGTYTKLESDLAYLHETTKYTITGGETCDASNTYSDCPNSVSRLALLHWTYMNRQYNQKVYDKWKAQSCYQEIDIALGYRLRLVKATIPNAVNPGSLMNLSFHFSNDGYAAPTQLKPIQVVLTHTITGIRTFLNYSGTNDDIRFWLPGEILSEGSVMIPGDLPDGNYGLGIRIPDKSGLLAESPAYSIQLANAGIWDNGSGTNSLNHIISVGEGGEGSLPEAPANLEAATVSESQISLVWTDNSDNETGFEIMRAEGNGLVWEFVAIVSTDVESYTDNNLKRGTYYNYIIRSVNNYGFSTWSDSSKSATIGVYVDTERNKNSQIYPNPLTGNALTIQFSDNSEKQIVISSVTGARLLETSTNKMNIQISRELFIPGIYFVTLFQNNMTENKKLIVI